MDSFNFSPDSFLNGAPTNSTNPNGTGTGIIPFSYPIWLAMSAFTAIALWNVLELNISIFMTFKKRRGLYFWALLVCSWGIVGHAVSLVLKFFTNYNPFGVCTLLALGWWSMINGQSLVLYSRLHLVVRNEHVMKGVLAMIIIDGIVLCIATSVATYGASSSKAELFNFPFSIIEKVQMTVFTVQETIISGIYVYYTVKMVRPALDGNRGRLRRAMLHLIWINFIIVLMDMSILALEYHNDYQIQSTMKSAIYSIKLKLEFAVLNQLMRLSRNSVGDVHLSGDMGASVRHVASGPTDGAELQGIGDRQRSYNRSIGNIASRQGTLPQTPKFPEGNYLDHCMSGDSVIH